MAELAFLLLQDKGHPNHLKLQFDRQDDRCYWSRGLLPHTILSLHGARGSQGNRLSLYLSLPLSPPLSLSLSTMNHICNHNHLQNISPSCSRHVLVCVIIDFELKISL